MASKARNWMGGFGFVLFATMASVVYGILHDLVTAHVAIDYFTVFHPHLIESKEPVPIAFAWGVVATWWVGLLAGVILVASNLLGRMPSLTWRLLRRRFTVALVILWVSAMVVLGLIYGLASAFGSRKASTFEHDKRLISVAITHGYSYLGAVVAIIGLAIWIAFDRVGFPTTNIEPKTAAE